MLRFDLATLFPEVEPGQAPTGYKILIQIRVVPEKTKGGLIITQDTRDADQIVTTVGKVVAVGPAAYRDRATGREWIGAPWCKVGDYVRVPKYAGVDFRVNDAPFRYYNDEDVIAILTEEAAAA